MNAKQWADDALRRLKNANERVRRDYPGIRMEEPTHEEMKKLSNAPDIEKIKIREKMIKKVDDLYPPVSGKGKGKKSANSWIVALKKFNSTKSKWTVPKKGTEDYKKVIKLMKN